MSDSSFLRALDERVLVGDGGMGVMLGGGPDLPKLNVDRPTRVRRIHEDFARAGADVLRTNTFTAGRLGARSGEVIRAGVDLARAAAGKERFVAGSIGPLLDAPMDESRRSECYREQCETLAEGGCDFLLLETFTDALDLELAFQAARPWALPVVCQMVSPKDGMLKRLESSGAEAIGLNCLGPDEAIRELSTISGRRVTVWPHAGIPREVEGKLVYPVRPASFAVAAEQIVKRGVRLVGGCCGAGPEHIQLVAKMLK